jgi:hypothetical protein
LILYGPFSLLILLLLRQGQSLEIADEPQNRSLGANGGGTKPELGTTEARRPNFQQGRVRSITAPEAVEVPNNSTPELHGTRREEVPDYPTYELYDTRRNMVEIPGNPVHELSSTWT